MQKFTGALSKQKTKPKNNINILSQLKEQAKKEASGNYIDRNSLSNGQYALFSLEGELLEQEGKFGTFKKFRSKYVVLLGSGDEIISESSDCTIPSSTVVMEKLSNSPAESQTGIIGNYRSVSYTHLTLPTNREV